jgi:nitric oxide reductase NorD protein
MFNFKEKDPNDTSLEKALDESLNSIKNVVERRTIMSLARELGRLPKDRSLAAIEMSASLTGVSLRATKEFLRAAPIVAQVLSAIELKSWGEIGRRLAMSNVEAAIGFFQEGIKGLDRCSPKTRMLILEICTKQMVLSTTFALDTFRRSPFLIESVQDGDFLDSILEAALEISQRSAKHSVDFLSATPEVVKHLDRLNSESVPVAALKMVEAFTARVGGMAADAWGALPNTLVGLDEERALSLFERVNEFLGFSGSAALHLLIAGGQVQRIMPDLYNEWCELLKTAGEKGNASLVAMIRLSPSVIQSLSEQLKTRRYGDSDSLKRLEIARRVISLVHSVARVDAESAISCFRSSAKALRLVTIEQLEEWVNDGLNISHRDARARRSYFALETRQSNSILRSGDAGLPLESISYTLRLYIEALTGRSVEISPLTAVPDESKINDGRTIFLPSLVTEFSDDNLNFRLYKVLAAHAAGQIEFGTHERDTSDLKAVYHNIKELFLAENVDAIDAFSLDGYINDVSKSEAALPSDVEMEDSKPHILPTNSDYKTVLALFPQKGLATRIFGTLENGRIDRRLRYQYRGLSRDLDLIRDYLREGRPRIIDLPVTLVPFELLFQITLCGGARQDARQYYGQIVSEMESVVTDYLGSPVSTVADTLMATNRIYALFQSITPDASEQQEQPDRTEGEEEAEGTSSELDNVSDMQTSESKSEQMLNRSDARELFNAWANVDLPGEPEDYEGAENWTQVETPEQPLEEGEVAYNYDEWDRELSDHRVGWCRVVEKYVHRGSRSFVEITRSRYKGTISSIRHQFQLMRPEDLKRINNELDGDDYNLNAVLDYIVDRKANGHQSERLYIKRLRRERSVAVSFLLDQSSSTARTIGRNPLQPYTSPGRRIIDIEKEGLVLMSEALEAVGDTYAINGFTSEGRRNVKFFVIKDFDERYSEEIERRIGGITYQNNTRLGAAIRHAAKRLALQEARTRLLIMLTDGRPYDHDYGDARYAREDTREALKQAKLAGIIPFCITIDRDSEAELKDLYGQVGYTIIDDVLSLPERMPAIYRRLTC